MRHYFAERVMLGECVFSRITDQAARGAHFVHHLITGIDASGTGNAFELQAVADIDPGRADLDAYPAVDAVAFRNCARIDPFPATAVDASGAVSAFTATIPEPGTLLLLGLALAARRRRGAPCG